MSTDKEDVKVTIIPATLPLSKVVSVDQSSFEERPGRGHIAQTVPPCIVSENIRPKTNSDKAYGDILIISYVIFIASSIWVFANAHPKYKISDDSGDGDVKTISDFYYTKVEQCCATVPLNNRVDWEENASIQDGLCSMINDAGEKNGQERHLESSTDPKHKFLGDEGIFDAFLERPDIIFYITVVIITFAISWIHLLQKYAKSVVIATEVVKMFGILFCGLNILFIGRGLGMIVGTGILGMGIITSYVSYVYNNVDDIMKASKVITHSVTHLRKNNGMTYQLLCLKIMFFIQTLILFITLCTSYEIVEVRPYQGSCYYVSPSYLKYLNSFQISVWIWTVCTLNMVRLFLVAYTTGTSYFQQNEQDGILKRFSSVLKKALSSSSFGTLAFAGLVTSFLDLLRRRNKRCLFWFGPQIILLVIIEVIFCIFGTCLLNIAYVWTKFSVVIHAFQGRSFRESSQRCHEIMRRRFVGGYITEISTSSMLWLSSVIFSCLTALISWGWFDAAFHCTSFEDSSLLIFPIIIGIFFVHPVFGILIVIGINISIQKVEMYHYENGRPTYQHLWVPPVAAAFVGCAAKLVFGYMSGIIQDAVDTMLLCFAIDEDNGVTDRAQNEFTCIVKDMKEYIKADPVIHYDIEAERVLTPSLDDKDKGKSLD